ncbi:PREDICTED: probable transcription factor At1g61730 [Camelina sativa]|uniref:Probable transcription factor At1g61730 n=1 Tax=Camelina sativa TaxID=90675 RepID=A0ABM0XSB6_CAMSA|nr:PREDICTED: probable transcription factor At1g61730 [Camelina sativa]
MTTKHLKRLRPWEPSSSDSSSCEKEDELTMDVKLQSSPASDVAAATPKASSEKKKTVPAKKAKKKEVCVSGEAKKRASEETSTEDVNAAKRAKKDVKKPNNQRLWTEEDEIRVLQGILAFKSLTGKTTTEDKSGFYEFIKDSISVKVSLSQCIEKIKTVKRKFMNKWKKDKKPASTEAHNLKSFELSKMIWGVDDAEESRKNEGIKKLEDEDVVFLEQRQDWFKNSFLFRQVASLGVNEDSLKRRWSSVDTEKKKRVEDAWRVLQTKELGLVSQKSELLHEVVALIAEGI